MDSSKSFFNKRILIITAIALILILGFAYYLYYFQNFQKQAPVSGFEESYAKALKMYYAGDERGAIAEIEKNLKDASNKELEAKARITLAFAYLKADVPKGVQIFKEVAADSALPKGERAGAIKDMADLYMLGPQGVLNNQFLVNIFKGNPYSSFLNPVPGAAKETESAKYRRGINNLYKYSLTISPLAISEFRLAERDAKIAISLKDGALAQKPLRSLGQIIKEGSDHFANGNLLMPEFARANPGNGPLGYAYWLDGEVFGLMGQLQNNKGYFAEAEEAFKKSIALLKAPSNFDGDSSYINFQLLWADFEYASFLAKAYGKSRAPDIIAILSDIKNTDPAGKSNSGLMGYLKWIGNDSVHNSGTTISYDYKNALTLAKINPKFAELLKSLSWKLK